MISVKKLIETLTQQFNGVQNISLYYDGERFVFEAKKDSSGFQKVLYIDECEASNEIESE